jgi:hypothetical protein
MTPITVPTRQTNHLRQSRSNGDKSYTRLVVQPARRFFWLTLAGYLAGAWAALVFVTDALLLVGYDVAPFTVKVRLVTGTLALAVWAAALQGRRLVMALHDEYMGEFDVVETTTTEERRVMSEQARVIPLNETGAVVIRRPAKTLNGVTFRGEWLERMTAAVQDGNMRLTRDASGISGSAYGDCVRVLRQGGYLDSNNEWTEAGVTWLATV